ncbi:hypothetical protein LMG31886_13340 [Xanthomonas hydrangeae]|nr:hypothetical protein LMG31886_13340 [Xanthomonas hydrangeae]CAD7729730.1 hypothetical protein LMG31886_13340 [Xanthomonas hydrangeae]
MMLPLLMLLLLHPQFHPQPQLLAHPLLHLHLLLLLHLHLHLCLHLHLHLQRRLRHKPSA